MTDEENEATAAACGYGYTKTKPTTDELIAAIERERDAFKEQFEDRDNRLKESEAENDSLTARLAAHAEDRAMLKHEIAAQKRIVENTCESYQRDLEGRDEQIVCLTAQLDAARRETARLKLQLDEFTEIEALSHARQVDENKALRAELEAVKAERDAWKSNKQEELTDARHWSGVMTTKTGQQVEAVQLNIVQEIQSQRDTALAQLASAQSQTTMDTECIERITKHGLDLEAQLADWQQKHSGLAVQLARCVVALEACLNVFDQFDGVTWDENGLPVKYEPAQDLAIAAISAAHGRDEGLAATLAHWPVDATTSKSRRID